MGQRRHCTKGSGSEIHLIFRRSIFARRDIETYYKSACLVEARRVLAIAMTDNEELTFASIQEELEYWKEKAMEYRQRYVFYKGANCVIKKVHSILI